MFTLSLAAGRELYPKGSLLPRLCFSDSDEQNLASQFFQIGRSKRTNIHVLKKDDIPFGFVALSVGVFNDVPSIFIDYLFTSEPYRKLTYPDLGETPLKVSQYLVGKTLEMAWDVNSKVPIRYIALFLADDRLADFYEEHGFEHAEGATGWMSQKVSGTKRQRST